MGIFVGNIKVDDKFHRQNGKLYKVIYIEEDCVYFATYNRHSSGLETRGCACIAKVSLPDMDLSPGWPALRPIHLHYYELNNGWIVQWYCPHKSSHGIMLIINGVNIVTYTDKDGKPISHPGYNGQLLSNVVDEYSIKREVDDPDATQDM